MNGELAPVFKTHYCCLYCGARERVQKGPCARCYGPMLQVRIMAPAEGGK